MRVRIYQTDNRDWVFEGWDWAMTHGFDQQEYKRVYETYLSDDTTLNDIFDIFNIDRPDDYEARSLSMSDIIVISEREDDPYDEVEVYYVDSFGFTDLDHDFWEDGLFEED